MSFTPRTADEHFAFQHLKNAAESLDAIAEEVNKASHTIRESNERFYHSLGLFAGGTVALSVTYLGYLKTLSKPVQHTHWLMESWIALLVCAACSLFSSFIYGLYMHYCMSHKYFEAMREKNETDVKEIGKLNVANLQTPAEMEAYKAPRVAAAADCAKRARREKSRERFWFHTWRWMGRTAQLGFLAGLSLLLLFAIKNM